ncbi:Protein YopD [Aeromonas jandaei]|uniref:YopD family type III secretion system translocon subunit n=1 Tax=Aeromonas jandaei TaxID=650 RepID=UPI00191D51E8|nr:YopD family type III secretion system translocon subunit [Aeromonas jandaei]MBL0626070.1 YopD family type III secretion system translocon subunit [Aeromonas jandaei]
MSINVDYSLHTNTVAAMSADNVDKSSALAKSATSHEAATVINSATESRKSSRPELIQPNQGIDTTLLAKGKGELDGMLGILLALLEMSRRAREMGLQQRDMENLAVLSAQKEQVNEMRDGAKLMIAMAVVSGVMTGISAVMGTLSSVKQVKAIKQEKVLNTNIAKQGKELEQLTDLKKGSGKELGAAGKDLSEDLQKNTIQVSSLNKKFDLNNTRQQLVNTVLQGLTQMANSAIQYHEADSQADAKEDEFRANVSQTEKQKVEDNMAYNVNFMKDVLQMMQQYSQSHNQAMRAAFGVA